MVYDYGYLKGNKACQGDDNCIAPSDELRELISSNPNYSEYVTKAY